MTDEAYAALAALLERELAGLVRRLRGWSHGAWRAAARPFATRDAVVAHLVAELAVAAQGVEEADATAPPAWRVVPPLPVHALADAVAVTGRDLLEALRATTGQAPVWSARGRTTAEAVASTALAEVVLHRRHLDGSRPGRESKAALTPLLGDGDLLALAAARCPRDASAYDEG